jgi:hypothetical protein
MDEMNWLSKLDKVKAPPDFEQKVMAQLSLKKRSARQRRTVWRWSMAGAAASLLALVVLLNIFVLQPKAPLGVSKMKSETASVSLPVQNAAADQAIPVIETLDYSTEVRSCSREPEAVYLLEQISDTTPREISY